jgi:hypothetical protein
MGVLASFERELPYAAGEVEQDIFLNDALDQLMHLLRVAVQLWTENQHETQSWHQCTSPRVPCTISLIEAMCLVTSSSTWADK